MARLVGILKQLATQLGRTLEYAITGQSDFAVLTSEFRDFDHVTDIIKARRVLSEAREQVARDFNIRLRAPLILELFTDDDAYIRSVHSQMHHTVGFYRPHEMGDKKAHTVYLRKGLEKGRFKAVAAHEMVHAYERETGILTTRLPLREGFARWIEYKVLVSEGCHREAGRVLGIRSWRFGRAVRTLVAMEKEHGVEGVLKYLHSIP